MFNHGTLCSFSGIWTAFWISFWSLSEDCLVLSTTNQSFLTLMPHKNSATSREEPCRLQKVYRYIQSSFRNCEFPFSYYSTSILQNSFLPKYICTKLWLNDFNCLILNVNLILFKVNKVCYHNTKSYRSLIFND